MFPTCALPARPPRRYAGQHAARRHVLNTPLRLSHAEAHAVQVLPVIAGVAAHHLSVVLHKPGKASRELIEPHSLTHQVSAQAVVVHSREIACLHELTEAHADGLRRPPPGPTALPPPPQHPTTGSTDLLDPLMGLALFLPGCRWRGPAAAGVRPSAAA